MHGTEPAVGERRFEVAGLTRVEGEGSLRLTVRDGAVTEAHLAIFEAPRYFEQLVLGRTPDDVLDIVARICGICPIAYQMSAVHAFEALFGVAIDPATHTLRRLLYCGEWIESHALHIYLLHAPDFFGLASAVELAAVIVRRSSVAWPSRRSATTSCRSSAAGPSTRSASGSAASPGRPGARS